MNASDYVVIPKSVLVFIEEELKDKPWILFSASKAQPLAPIIDKARGEGFDAGVIAGCNPDDKDSDLNKQEYLNTEFEIQTKNKKTTKWQKKK